MYPCSHALDSRLLLLAGVIARYSRGKAACTRRVIDRQVKSAELETFTASDTKAQLSIVGTGRVGEGEGSRGNAAHDEKIAPRVWRSTSGDSFHCCCSRQNDRF